MTEPTTSSPTLTVGQARHRYPRARLLLKLTGRRERAAWSGAATLVTALGLLLLHHLPHAEAAALHIGVAATALALSVLALRPVARQGKGLTLGGVWMAALAVGAFAVGYRTLTDAGARLREQADRSEVLRVGAQPDAATDGIRKILVAQQLGRPVVLTGEESLALDVQFVADNPRADSLDVQRRLIDAVRNRAPGWAHAMELLARRIGQTDAYDDIAARPVVPARWTPLLGEDGFGRLKERARLERRLTRKAEHARARLLEVWLPGGRGRLRPDLADAPLSGPLSRARARRAR